MLLLQQPRRLQQPHPWQSQQQQQQQQLEQLAGKVLQMYVMVRPARMHQTPQQQHRQLIAVAPWRQQQQQWWRQQQHMFQLVGGDRQQQQQAIVRAHLLQQLVARHRFQLVGAYQQCCNHQPWLTMQARRQQQGQVLLWLRPEQQRPQGTHQLQAWLQHPQRKHALLRLQSQQRLCQLYQCL